MSNMNNEKYHVNIYGLSGIVNMRNTCYMNSAIQALSHNYLLTQYLFTNKDEIIKTLLNNARKILKDNDNFKLELQNTIIPLQLKQKIHSENYSSDLLTAEEINIVLNNTITAQIIRLFEHMWRDNCIVMPTSFRKIFGEVRDKFFYGYEQHDAEEAYSCIIQKMQEELAEVKNIKFKTTRSSVKEFLNFVNITREKINNSSDIKEKENLFEMYKNMKKQMPKEALTVASFREMKKYYDNGHSFITEIFSGYSHSSICCPDKNCGFTNDRFDPFTHLSLSIPTDISHNQIDIIDCLKEYFSEETLDKDNLWTCEGCHNKVNAVKKTKLWTSPPILVVQLKRFGILKMSKDMRLVNFPLDNLDIKSVVSSYQFEDNLCTKYKLQCVINHSGGLNHGHYYTYNKFESHNKWFEFNDQIVTEIDNMFVERGDIVTKHAYILFYIRKDFIK
ncbi:putative ubiquitin carboxyl-terminal hydrolase [Cotonvirus japonicus]|uniref:Ubiquitin carboxyl-terminal hydrolase n=1 Tax=Cotonvirus japonicus TaxID=2811091 RepID=A0ABM7NT18_9VIRU|nr:putative ubiquitin carboxyl-terminal hydrolase [Cotonvirus japonicus]BCS83266.1 putative ubiquitin carboxyl-terminal hydrolase [Cotonvirus japonicus]